jgi:ATP-dependent protease ClpP protease subunit
MLKRSGSPFVFGSTNKKSKVSDKKYKKNKEEDVEDIDYEDENPFSFPNLFGKEDATVYLDQNHLFFRTEISENSVDLVKKLMRQYYTKIIKLQANRQCVKIVPKPLILHIYSPGGDVYAGLSLHDFIIEFAKTIPVHTVVEGVAASAATMISVAGSKRYISPTSYMLIHQLSTFVGGNFEQIKDEFDNCNKLMDRIKQIYIECTTIPKKQLADILKHDLIFDSTECKKYGLVDEIKLVDVFNDSE